MLVTTDFFDDLVSQTHRDLRSLMIRHFRFDHETLQQRRDEALVSAAKHLITALENASQRADALAYELHDYVERIEAKNKPKPKRKTRAKKGE
jgi:hypothetical protein